MEKFLLVAVEKNEVEKLGEIISNVYGIFGRSRTGSRKKHTHQGLIARLTQKQEDRAITYIRLQSFTDLTQSLHFRNNRKDRC